MTHLSAAGALAGLLLGAGSALLWPVWRQRSRQSLDDRLAPYVRDVVPPSRLLHATPAPAAPVRVLHWLLAPVLADAQRALERLGGGPTSLRRRLELLGTGHTVEQFRAEQVSWAAGGALSGLVVGLAGVRSGALSILAFSLLGLVGGALARDHLLTTQVRRREQRMLAEFPVVAELLALAVGAGEGAVGALEGVARTCQGELSAELRRTLADARAGANLVQALEGLARRTSLASLARFVDGVAVAVERGTPLGDVLRAQAQDVRELTRRRLIESGGRREIAMMVPVVFLILPVTVLFAVFPGLAVLELNL
jgi:tight adherence protein C